MGRNKDSSKPRGRMSAYAYFVQDSRVQHGKNNPNEQVVFAQFSKDCAAKWKSMDDKAKGNFHVLSASDKIRYDREMSTYKPPKGEKNKRRRRRKDPDAPKRNLSAFFIFSGDKRGAIKAVHPDWSVGDIAKELAVKWRAMTAGDKEKYDKGAAKDKERYIAAMAIYKAKAQTELAAFKAKAKHVKAQKRESSSSSSSDDSSSDDSSSDSDEE